MSFVDEAVLLLCCRMPQAFLNTPDLPLNQKLHELGRIFSV